MSENNNIQTLPLLPLKNTVLFPYLLMPLSVGRASSLAAVEAALATEEKEIVVFAQRDPSIDAPKPDDLYTVGTKAIIRKMSRANGGQMELLVLGMERVTLVKVDDSEPYLRARVQPYPLPVDQSAELEALQGALVELATSAIALAQPGSQQEVGRFLAASHEDPLRLAFLLASMFSLDLEKQQSLLEATARVEALRLMHTYLSHEVQVLELRNKINTEARNEMCKEQRDYLLRQQMRAIQQELGEKGGEQAEAEQLRERLEKADLPEDVRKEAERELSQARKASDAGPRLSRHPHLPGIRARTALEDGNRGQPRYRQRAPGARRGSLQPERSEGAHSRTARRAEAEPRSQGADPVLRRTSGSRQDFAGPVHRPRA